MIQISHVAKKYDTEYVFEDVSLEIAEKESIVITGESGSGKTTLIRMIAGFDNSYEGDIYIDGQRMDEKVIPRKRNVAVVFQDPVLWNHMKVIRNMSFGMKCADAERIKQLSRRLKIDDLLNRYPEELSGGQAKRVSLARALLSEKKYLLLDEPLANVDEVTKEVILKYLREEYMCTHSIFYVTHDRYEMKMLACREFRL